MLKLYNTLDREKEEFRPIEKGKVGLYSCGPTVYWFAHVGNMRAYVFADILRRVLAYDGFEVKHIINVTDVGHLTSDADEGEDKMEKSAKEEGKTAKEISHFYFDAFRKDFLKLNLTEPFKWTWATEHIEEQVDMIKSLEKKGFVYTTSDGVYFDTSKFGDYGKLSRKRIEDLEGGKRIDLGEKKNKTDFALWKFSKEGEKRQQEWESPWGVGFPGWHIECSAMAAKYLGETFDIHTGGEDHIPVHHENEIAQSTCCFGVKPVNYWMHGAFLNIKGGKMSKSLGNIETVSELEERGINPLAYRYFCFSASYRKPLTWSEEAIQGAVNSYKKLRNVCLALKSDGKINEKYLVEFRERIDDDLDMPGAMAVLWKLVRDEDAEGKVKGIRKMDEVFGLDLLEKGKVEAPGDVLKLAEEREKARGEKDFGRSDELRDLIKVKGWVVRDGKDGFELERI
ncbi:cysteine--tRNA ligase [archaeon]|nr:cysteine--tRNA ligase [archaeon]